ncbi:MAG: helix-turn-helix transcriptional regulator, partial [Candidatus Dormibacteraeota bacterium]|nr:helix-turn-helix transcriptional regulator [Candidatus Dormibacteraeota bacterium]
QQVCRYVLEGCSSTDIARALQLSGHTVRDHLSAIFGKVGVRSRRQLMAALLGV